MNIVGIYCLSLLIFLALAESQQKYTIDLSDSFYTKLVEEAEDYKLNSISDDKLSQNLQTKVIEQWHPRLTFDVYPKYQKQPQAEQKHLRKQNPVGFSFIQLGMNELDMVNSYMDQKLSCKCQFSPGKSKTAVHKSDVESTLQNQLNSENQNQYIFFQQPIDLLHRTSGDNNKQGSQNNSRGQLQPLQIQQSSNNNFVSQQDELLLLQFPETENESKKTDVLNNNSNNQKVNEDLAILNQFQPQNRDISTQNLEQLVLELQQQQQQQQQIQTQQQIPNNNIDQKTLLLIYQQMEEQKQKQQQEQEMQKNLILAEILQQQQQQQQQPSSSGNFLNTFVNSGTNFQDPQSLVIQSLLEQQKQVISLMQNFIGSGTGQANNVATTDNQNDNTILLNQVLASLNPNSNNNNNNLNGSNNEMQQLQNQLLELIKKDQQKQEQEQQIQAAAAALLQQQKQQQQLQSVNLQQLLALQSNLVNLPSSSVNNLNLVQGNNLQNLSMDQLKLLLLQQQQQQQASSKQQQVQQQQSNSLNGNTLNVNSITSGGINLQQLLQAMGSV